MKINIDRIYKVLRLKGWKVVRGERWNLEACDK